MARLLIVSRSMALAMRLADQHQVVEHSADELESLLPGIDADVLVLDVGDPVLAVNTVNSLREAEQDIPVLLVSGYQPEWEQVEAQEVEGVHVVPLPITRIALLQGISALTGEASPINFINTGDIELPPPIAAGVTQPMVNRTPPGSPSAPPVVNRTPPPPSSPSSASSATPSRPIPDAGPKPAAAVATKAAPVAKTAPVDPPTAGTPVTSVPTPASSPAPAAQKPVTAAPTPASSPAPAAQKPSSGPTPAAPTPTPAPAPAPASTASRTTAPDAGATARPTASPTDRAAAAAVAAGAALAAEKAAAPPPPETLAAAAGLGPHTPTPDSPAPPRAANAVPAHARRPPGLLSIGTGDVPSLHESDVAGLSYSSAITRPFRDEPKTGSFPFINGDQPQTQMPSTPAVPAPPARPAQRWSRNSSLPVDADPAPGAGPASPAARRMPRLGNRPRKLQRNTGVTPDPAYRTPPGMGLVTDPLGPRTEPHGFPASALDRRLDAEAASLVSARPVPGDDGASLRTADLVRLVHERIGDLYGVSDTAQVLADDVIERADADAAAILVPDGPVWRISGGVGLRPLERRLVLEDSHWLITEIGSAGRAVLIEDTDIIRQQLSGAPLAAWRHLLAVPVPDVRAIVVLARGKEAGPFTDRDLSAVIAPVREAAALLAQALATRRLARALGPLQESETDPAAAPRRRPDE